MALARPRSRSPETPGKGQTFPPDLPPSRHHKMAAPCQETPLSALGFIGKSRRPPSPCFSPCPGSPTSPQKSYTGRLRLSPIEINFPCLQTNIGHYGDLQEQQKPDPLGIGLKQHGFIPAAKTAPAPSAAGANQPVPTTERRRVVSPRSPRGAAMFPFSSQHPRHARTGSAAPPASARGGPCLSEAPLTPSTKHLCHREVYKRQEAPTGPASLDPRNCFHPELTLYRYRQFAWGKTATCTPPVLCREG